jgi:hypothetical protein
VSIDYISFETIGRCVYVEICSVEYVFMFIVPVVRWVYGFIVEVGLLDYVNIDQL